MIHIDEDNFIKTYHLFYVAGICKRKTQENMWLSGESWSQDPELDGCNVKRLGYLTRWSSDKDLPSVNLSSGNVILQVLHLLSLFPNSTHHTLCLSFILSLLTPTHYTTMSYLTLLPISRNCIIFIAPAACLPTLLHLPTFPSSWFLYHSPFNQPIMAVCLTTPHSPYHSILKTPTHLYSICEVTITYLLQLLLIIFSFSPHLNVFPYLWVAM